MHLISWLSSNHPHQSRVGLLNTCTIRYTYTQCIYTYVHTQCELHSQPLRQYMDYVLHIEGVVLVYKAMALRICNQQRNCAKLEHYSIYRMCMTCTQVVQEHIPKIQVVRAYMHTYMQTSTHAKKTHVHTQADMETRTNIHTHTKIRPHIYTCTLSCILHTSMQFNCSIVYIGLMLYIATVYRTSLGQLSVNILCLVSLYIRA